MLDKLISYLKQPSTYKGLAKIAAAAGFVGFPETWPLLLTGLVLIDGLIDTMKNDDPEKALTQRKQLIAKAEQMGLKLSEGNSDK
jgi:hypothetical protein